MKPTKHNKTEICRTKGGSAINFAAVAQALLGAGLDSVHVDKIIVVLPDVVEALNKGVDVEYVLARAVSDKNDLPALNNPNSGALPIEAERLFGSPPPQTRPTTYTKSAFPLEWFENEQIYRAANRTANQLGSKKVGTLTPEELERRRAAQRFVKAYLAFRNKPQIKGSILQP